MSEFIRRNLLEVGREALETFPAVVVQGARRVGKSTFADLLTRDRHRQIFTLDDTEVRAAAVADPRAFVNQFSDSTLVIDEIQRLPELMLEVKAAIDRTKTPGRFVLTGSSNLLRLRRTPDSLAGRAVTLNLGGFSQGELIEVPEDFASYAHTLGTENETLSPVEITSEWDRNDYAQAIARGSYPEVQTLSPRMRDLWYRNYLERLTERDAEDVIPSLTAPRLRAVLRALAANQSGELVKSRMAEVADLPATTITRYLDTLETLYLIFGLPPWNRNLTRRATGRQKVSITDSGVAAYLNHVNASQLSQLVGGEALGSLLEGFVAAELKKQQTWSDQQFELYHLRDYSGQEVDFVIEFQDGSVFLIEVKASSTYRSEQFTAMVKLNEQFGKRCRGGVVLGTSDHGFQYSSNLWGLPVSALWQHSALVSGR